jgi:hypothetical protein
MFDVLALIRRHSVATLALVLALTGTAFAAGNGISALTSANSRSSRIYACVTHGFRTLNLTTADAKCPHGERKLSWNIAGQPGKPGTPGLDGEQGPTGNTGPKGDKGPQGSKGDRGAQGLTGIQGPKGDQGDQGEHGNQGDPGPQGLTGDQGLKGDKGDKGDTGGTGPQGPTGVQGPKGDQGDQGIAGPQGAQGISGVTPLGDDTGSSSRLASPGETVAGGADIPFAGNSSLGDGITHTVGSTSFTVADAGRYRITAMVNITSGVGAALAVAVNGRVRPPTNVSILDSPGQTVTDSLLALAAGDVLTLRNNSAVTLATDAAPGVGAMIVIERIS